MPRMRILISTSALALLAACASPQQQPQQTQDAVYSPMQTPSGLIFQMTRMGSGDTPRPTDTVRVNYRGMFPDGREFDSSNGKPAEFPLDHVIKCWTEGLQLMKPGGKAWLICPAALAYGEKGAGATIPPNATLHFDVELLQVKR